MKLLLFCQAILATCIFLCEARHGMEHHGKHHEHRHHPQHDFKVNLKTMETPKNETISVEVTRKRPDSKSTLRVSLRVHIVRGGVHINGQKIDHSVITSVHIRTIVEEIFSGGRIIRKPAIINVRAMVSETTNANGVKILSFQEEILKVEDDEVEQIEVKEVLLELGDTINESRRTLNIVKISESSIHKHARAQDKHVWACKGKLPSVPFHVTRNEMKRWKHRHPRPPSYESGENKDGDSWDRGYDNNDDREGEKNKHGKHHHHHSHHHRGLKQWMHRFCRWFYKLPIATRAAFCISLILSFVLLFASCWACCCRKPSSKPTDAKLELDDTVSVNEEAEALPDKKKPIDEQPLIA